jgi:hypothetical protein
MTPNLALCYLKHLALEPAPFVGSGHGLDGSGSAQPEQTRTLRHLSYGMTNEESGRSRLFSDEQRHKRLGRIRTQCAGSGKPSWPTPKPTGWRCPIVGSEHEDAVRRVHQRHARRVGAARERGQPPRRTTTPSAELKKNAASGVCVTECATLIRRRVRASNGTSGRYVANRNGPSGVTVAARPTLQVSPHAFGHPGRNK